MKYLIEMGGEIMESKFELRTFGSDTMLIGLRERKRRHVIL
jgi:hypothetical protein